MDEIKNACVVSIEVDGRQAYIFETDKLQERLGASRILDNMREQAEGLARKSSGKVMIYSPVSGAIGAWAEKTNRSELLNFAWKLREWLAEHGVEHRIGYLETDKRHFTEPGNGTPVANLSERTRCPPIMCVLPSVLDLRSGLHEPLDSGTGSRRRSASRTSWLPRAQQA